MARQKEIVVVEDEDINSAAILKIGHFGRDLFWFGVAGDGNEDRGVKLALHEAEQGSHGRCHFPRPDGREHDDLFVGGRIAGWILDGARYP